jgi:hypothetical protein
MAMAVNGSRLEEGGLEAGGPGDGAGDGRRVKTGNPNGPGLPPWPEFGRTHYEFLDACVVK